MLQHGAIYFLGRFGAAAIGVLSVAIYTRLLSPGDYGLYTLGLAGAMMAYAAVSQWLTFALGRFQPAYRGREEIVICHVAVVYGAIALFGLAVVAVALPWVTPADTRSVVLLALGIFLAIGPAEMILISNHMREQAKRYAWLVLLRAVVTTTLAVALAYHGWGSTGLLLGAIAGHLCLLAISLPGAWRSLHGVRLRRKLFHELAAYGLPSAMTGALGAVIQASDRYIIAGLIGADAAGLYSAPYDLAMRSLHVLMMVVAMAGGPIIFRTFETRGEAAARPLIRRLGELLLGVGLPAAIACAMLAPAIADVLLGEAFHATARKLMPWIAAATVLTGFQSFFLGLAFSLPKKPLRQTLIFVVGAALNVVLNFILIPRLGLIGAALATLASYVAIVALSLYLGRGLFRLPWPAAGIAKILVACAVLALFLWPVHDTTELIPVMVHAVTGTAVYLLIFVGLDVGGTRHLLTRTAQFVCGVVGLRPGR